MVEKSTMATTPTILMTRTAATTRSSQKDFVGSLLDCIHFAEYSDECSNDYYYYKISSC